MKRNWQIKRDLIEHSNGQFRWDKAYQLLMQMTGEVAQTAVPVQTDDSPPLLLQEEPDDNRSVCSSVNPTANPNPND